MTMISRAQGTARTIYKAAARLPISRNLMRLHTAKQGTVGSNALNKVLGVNDSLARLELFHGKSDASQVARSYLDGITLYIGAPIPTSTEAIYNIASNRTDDYGSASLLAQLATNLLKEAGYEIPVVSSDPRPRWNTSISFMITERPSGQRSWIRRLLNI